MTQVRGVVKEIRSGAAASLQGPGVDFSAVDGGFSKADDVVVCYGDPLGGGLDLHGKVSARIAKTNGETRGSLLRVGRSMLVAVMEVGVVRVSVLEALVPVGVRMGLSARVVG